MRKYSTGFSKKIILILILSAQNLLVPAQKTADSVSPLHLCWDLSVEGINKAKLGSDNASRIFVSSRNGIVESLDQSDGNQNWKTELGGDVLSVNYKDGFLYVVSLSPTDNSTIVRALSAETGLVKWQRAFNTVNPQNSVSPAGFEPTLIQDSEFLFFAIAGGDLYKLAKDTGAELEKIGAGGNITTYIKTSDRKIAFGTDRRQIIVYSLIDKTITKLSLNEIPTVIHFEPERIIVGDGLGKLTSLKVRTGKKEWQIRVGAEVSKIAETAEGLAVSSNDNFIYLISPKNGAKIWKKRFAGRIAAAAAPSPESQLAVVNLNGDTAALLDTKSGKIINQIKLPDSVLFTGEPLFVNKSLVFKTNTGLMSYSSDAGCSTKKERPEDKSGL